jgi:hypothetical protein
MKEKNFFQNACDAVTLVTLSIKKDKRVVLEKIGNKNYLKNQLEEKIKTERLEKPM